MALKNLKKDPSLTDKAYSAIKSAIMSNELTPGTVLAEENLASQLGISAHRSVQRCSVCSMRRS